LSAGWGAFVARTGETLPRASCALESNDREVFSDPPPTGQNAPYELDSGAQRFPGEIPHPG